MAEAPKEEEYTHGEAEGEKKEEYFNHAAQPPAATTGGPGVISDIPFTFDELAKHDGTGADPSDVFVAVAGVVYKVSAENYGPAGKYHNYAGKDASRPLAKGTFEDVSEANSDWSTLSDEHQARLQDWVSMYQRKYPVVGKVVPDEAFIKKGKEFEP